MLDNITKNITKIFDSLAGKKFISEDDLNNVMREIRIALLEADVSLPIAKDFIEKVVLYSALEGQTRNKNATDAIILIQAVLFPCVKFLYTYFLLCGYVDGWRGLIYAVNMSLHSLLVRIFWYENKHKHA
jgi:hypothetical protein